MYISAFILLTFSDRSRIVCTTYIDPPAMITLSKIVQYSGFREISQVGHIFCLLELWGIPLVDIFLVHSSLLQISSNIQVRILSNKFIHKFPIV